MKISIEVDLDPSEFHLASELLRTLNLFTEHVKVKGGAGAPPSAAAAAPGGARGAGVPAAAAPVAARSLPNGQAAAAPVAAPIAAPAGASRPAALPKTADEAKATFTELLRCVGGPGGAAASDAVAAELSRLLTAPGGLPQSTLVSAFIEAFTSVAFDPANIKTEQSTVPFMMLLPRLPEPLVTGTGSIKAATIQRVLAHLAVKRAPSGAKREDFYLQAEAFAALAELEFVTLDGAVQTIEKLLKSPEKRAAAITTLGKTVERCSAKLAAGANPAFVAALFAQLDTINQPEYKYDLEYIYQSMGRPLPAWLAAGSTAPPAAAPAGVQAPAIAAPVAAPVAAAPAPAAAAPPPVAPPSLSMRLQGTFSSPGSSASASIFAMICDPVSQSLVTGGQECPIIVWGADGRVQQSIPVGSMYVCNIDMDLTNRVMLLCGLPQGGAASKPRTSLFDARPGQPFTHRGDVTRDDVTMVAVVRSLPGSSHFVVGESVAVPGGSGAAAEQAALYDISQAGQANAQPLSRFTGHRDMITCIAPVPEAPGVFLTGSRDQTVKVWDSRSPTSAVATLGVAKGDIASPTHSEMVTCLDVSGQSVISGSLDGSLALWDLRATDAMGTFQPAAVVGNASPAMLATGSGAWNNNGIVKAVMAGAPYERLAAVATIQGLFTVDFGAAAPAIRLVASAVGPDGVPKQYGDIRWGPRGQLFAAPGVGVAVDVLECAAA